MLLSFIMSILLSDTVAWPIYKIGTAGNLSLVWEKFIKKFNRIIEYITLIIMSVQTETTLGVNSQPLTQAK